MLKPVLLDLPRSIHTERLLLRVPRPGDGVVVHEAVSESLAELRAFLASLPWIAEEPSVELSESFCRNAEANFLARRDLPFLMFDKASNTYLGSAGLHRPDWSIPKLEIGFWCRSSKTGYGYVSEAVEALVRYATQHTGAVRLEIITDEANTRSRRVAERCNFALEGILRNERRAPDGSLRDTCVYARCVGGL